MVNDSKNLSLLTFGMKEKSDDYDYSNGCFISNDTLGLLHDIEHPDNSKVLYITEHIGDIEDQKKEIKEIVDVFKNAKNWVVVSSSYVSVVDFPEENITIHRRILIMMEIKNLFHMMKFLQNRIKCLKSLDLSIIIFM